MTGNAAIRKSEIVVDRWRNTFFVAEDSYRRSTMRDLLDGIERTLAEEISERCAMRLGQWFGSETEEVWLVRELNLDFVLDVSKPDAGEVAPAWTEQIAADVAARIARGPDADAGVLCFPDRPAYLAQFVLDLAGGQAWSKWYYEEFRSLRLLSTSRAIAEVLSRDPQDGGRTILHIGRTGRLDELLSSLTEGDARTIYHCCLGGSLDLSSSVDALTRPSDLTLWVGRVLEVLNDEPIRAAVSGIFHEAIRWLVLTGLRFSGAETDPTSCAAVEGLIELRRVLREIRSPIVADRLMRELVEKSVSMHEVIHVARERGVQWPEQALRFLAIVAQGDSHWAAQAGAVLLRDQLPAAHAMLAAESIVSGFAGMFLLGPALVQLNGILEDMAGGGEHAKDIASFLRYVVLVKCAGSSRTSAAVNDIGLRLLAGCHRATLPDGFRAWPEFEVRRASALLSQNPPAFSRCDGRCLVAEMIVAAQSGKQVLLLRDVARDEWMHTAVVEPTVEARTMALSLGLNRIREATGNGATVLLHSSMARFAESTDVLRSADHVMLLHNDLDLRQLNDTLLSAGSISSPLSSEKYARLLHPSGHEFSYFSWTTLWPELDCELDVVTSALARSAMREFARHLMGFQSSSPEHLYQNFLDGVGSIRNGNERIEVDLPRSPLFLVLQVSGLTGQMFPLPWLEGKAVCLLASKE